MAMPGQFQVVHPQVQSAMGGAHLHTPPSIFQHMMGQENSQSQPGNWNQVPQVPPMYMPWSVASLQQPQLVRFTGEIQQQTSPGPTLHQKRKLDLLDVTEPQRTKQFISAEKMAARFKDMHISHTSVPSTSTDFNPQPSTSTDVDFDVEPVPSEIDDGKSTHPRLVISEELRRLQQEPLLPASLLSKLDRPSMALVLWEPPSRHLRMLSTRHPSQPNSPSTSSATEEEDNNNNTIDNNNELIPDLNQMGFEPSNVELEPMDL